MNRAERIYRIHALLRERPRSLARLMEDLEASRATVVRDIGYMRDFMDAPIDYDRDTNGYRYRESDPGYELPGLWLNESELFGLLASERMLDQMQPGLLHPYIGPLRARIRKLLAQSGHSAAAIGERIRLRPFSPRRSHPERFGTLAGALLQGRRLKIAYHGRQRDAVTERVVHPQRLLRYRDNWYLIAWCELAEGLRSFSVDRIHHAEALPAEARVLDAAELDRHQGASFGIFSGSAVAWAVLRFGPEMARWVCDEEWHPDQIGQWTGDHYQLQVPYSDTREILLEILRYGPDVEVLAPKDLREMVAERLRAAAGIYSQRVLP